MWMLFFLMTLFSFSFPSLQYEESSAQLNLLLGSYVDYQSEKIYVNRIFKWFKKDFGNLTKYLCQYLKNDSYDDIKDFKVVFLDYDWTINSK